MEKEVEEHNPKDFLGITTFSFISSPKDFHPPQLNFFARTVYI